MYCTSTQRLTTHEIIYFNVLKSWHHCAVFKCWTVANEDRLKENKRKKQMQKLISTHFSGFKIQTSVY